MSTHIFEKPSCSTGYTPENSSLPIRDYLCRESMKLKARSRPWFSSRDAWEKERPRQLDRYLDTMGLTHFLTENRQIPSVKITKIEDRLQYSIENFHIEALPNLFMTGSLYKPRATSGPMPAIVYFSGHAKHPRLYYQAHPRLFAQLGFVVVILDTVMFGEKDGVHHGLYNRGWWQWTSLGYNPAAIETAIGIRTLDWLVTIPEVDPERIGATGISGGGGTSWWVAAADERVKAVASVCGTGTNASHVHGRALDGHCDCLVYPNIHGEDLTDIYALVAPRPALIGAALYDDSYAIAGVRDVYRDLSTLYASLGAPEHVELVETPSAHAYHAISRHAVFSFFLKHLQHSDRDDFGDIDESPANQEPLEVFQVYDGDGPDDNRVPTIQTTWIQKAPLPDIKDSTEHAQKKQEVIWALRRSTFAHFPKEPAPLNLALDWEWAFGSRRVQRYAFNSEPGARLLLHMHWPQNYGELGRSLQMEPAEPESSTEIHDSTGDPTQGLPPLPVLLMLRSPEEPRWQGEGFVGPWHRDTEDPWAHAYLEARGVGEASWGRDLDWHVRRSLPLLGRTVASLRVYDALRAIAAMRAMSNIDPKRIILGGIGEMALVAMYAALLDGQVNTLILRDPPVTQDVPGKPDGTCPALEMLHCLRHTDAPHVAGLLWPTELVFVNEAPYPWAKELYQRLGTPERFVRVESAFAWRDRR